MSTKTYSNRHRDSWWNAISGIFLVVMLVVTVAKVILDGFMDYKTPNLDVVLIVGWLICGPLMARRLRVNKVERDVEIRGRAKNESRLLTRLGDVLAELNRRTVTMRKHVVPGLRWEVVSFDFGDRMVAPSEVLPIFRSYGVENGVNLVPTHHTGVNFVNLTILAAQRIGSFPKGVIVAPRALELDDKGEVKFGLYEDGHIEACSDSDKDPNFVRAGSIFVFLGVKLPPEEPAPAAELQGEQVTTDVPRKKTPIEGVEGALVLLSLPREVTLEDARLIETGSVDLGGVFDKEVEPIVQAQRAGLLEENPIVLVMNDGTYRVVRDGDLDEGEVARSWPAGTTFAYVDLNAE